MKIGIDARFYGPKAKGLGRYTEKLIQYLQEVDKENEYVIFLRRNNWSDFQPKNKNFKKVLADFRWYSLEEQLKMPFCIRKERVNLMHFPHFNVPLFYFGAYIVTIHDLILTRFPTERASTLGPFLYKIKHTLYKIVIRRAIKKAKKIITVSHYSKKDIEDNFPFSRGKIEVTYEATSDLKLTPAKVDKEKFFQQYNFRPPFLLYVGNVYPHKNLERFLLSFKNYLKENPVSLFLVLVGRMDYFFRRLKKYAEELKLSERVRFLGYVNDEELKFLYQNASLYIFPSLAEGFGLPPLEAMSQGLPVLSSNSSCLPEILGEAALYFNPRDVDDMKEKLKMALSSQSLQQEMRRKGFLQVKKYSWPDLAKKTFSIYNSVLKNE